MGFLSGLFGNSKEEKALKEAYKYIQQILENEEIQLEFLHPTMKQIIASRPSYDRDPNGSGPFGYCETNPIPVNGPIGELAYLSKLETENGERILFHRIGAIDEIDVFEATTYSGNEWFLFFVDYYHPRKSRIAPKGFRFTEKLGQFSGFHNYCENFPYDFVDKKHAQNATLRLAYIPIGNVTPQLEKGAFNRPVAHMAKLDIVRSRMTSTVVE